MPEIATWLASLGLSEYIECFAANGIEIDVLRDLTDQDLKELGVLLGHRRRMLRAIRELAHASADARSAPPPAAPDSAERRQLTVMFCDLVGSTALSGWLDPEDMRELIRAYQDACSGPIARYEGLLAKLMGDGVLAYFGYPSAHEDDPERATRAGLDIIAAVNLIRRRSDVTLQVRIGVATGLVVVGDLVGSGEAQERGIIGDTPNVAARLQGVAEPNTIVIDPRTRRLLGALFECKDLGPIQVKGLEAPFHAYQVLRPSTVESRFEALRTTTTPLVGRDEEIETLMRRWQKAKEGDGSVVLISGEAGLGKSRIAQAVQDRLGSQSYTRLRYFCSPHHQDSALFPVITQLERAAGLRRDDSVEQRLTKLEAVLAQATNNLGEVVPLIAALLSIPSGDRYPPLEMTPQRRKEQTLKALLGQVEGLAARHPMLMVFEDAHWIDPTTREALDLIIEHIARQRVLLIITYRPEFSAPWVGRPQVSVLTLNRLAPQQRAEMISGVVGGKALPRKIVDQIIDRTDGIPLFIEELTKAVIESGAVAEVGDHYQVAGPITPLAIPTSLHASLLARLDRLAPVRDVAHIAAALGRQFSHELISAVGLVPQQQLDDGLARLVRAELLFQRGSPPDAEYTFKHALVQDAAYSTLLHRRRQQLHGRIAKTLEQRFPEIGETQPELMARHCAEAGMIDKAVGYWLKAGQQAIARWAVTEAAAQVRKGLDRLSSVPAGRFRHEQELNLQITLGHALMATKGFAAPVSAEAFARAHQLCDRLTGPAELGPVLYGQWAIRQVRGELQEAEQYAKEIHDLGCAQSDAAWKYFGAYARGVTCSFMGNFIDARTYIENALTRWDPRYRVLAPSPLDPYVGARTHLFRTLLCLGYLDQGRLQRDEALAEARRLSPYTLAYTLFQAWYVDWACGGVHSRETMLRSAEEVLAISSEQGFTFPLAVGNVMRGWCVGAMGQAPEGIALLLQGINSYRATW